MSGAGPQRGRTNILVVEARAGLRASHGVDEFAG
jgi:hypothetical protein